MWDRTISKVSLPEGVADSDDSDIIDTVAETACYTRLAEPYMVEQYAKSEEFWAMYKIQPSWAYFGAHDGLYRAVPAIHQKACGEYDPRRRPWFVAASSGPKDVVLVIDASKSMLNRGRINITRDAAETVVDTLTVHDRFTVIAFSNETMIFDEGWKTMNVANQNGLSPGLIHATIDNKKKMKDAIKTLEPDDATNFYDAFDTAFDAINNAVRIEGDSSGGQIALLFMTDGKIKEMGTPEEKAEETNRVIGRVNERTQELDALGRKVIIFTYSLGSDSDQEVVKNIACSSGGIWTPIVDGGDLVSKMSSYYKLFAMGLGEGSNKDIVTWVEPYRFFTRGVNGTTVSVPVYDTSVTPPLFLGGESNDGVLFHIPRQLKFGIISLSSYS